MRIRQNGELSECQDTCRKSCEETCHRLSTLRASAACPYLEAFESMQKMLEEKADKLRTITCDQIEDPSNSSILNTASCAAEADQ